MCSHYVGTPRYACSDLFGVNVREWIEIHGEQSIEAKALSDKNLTKCTAVVRGDETYL